METLNLDFGLKEVKLHERAGTLSFNPTDPNIGVRFRELYEYIPTISSEYDSIRSKHDDDTDEGYEALMDATRDIDLRVKDKLSYTFGAWNDFDAIFMGMNFMALGNGGQPVIYNFLEAMAPIIISDVDERTKLMESKMEQAKTQQAKNREQRRSKS